MMLCKNCNHKINPIIKIGKQPISSVFLDTKKKLKNYSLDLYECIKCKLVQTSLDIKNNDMYGSTYGYRTSLSDFMIKHMKKKYQRIMDSNFLKKNSNVLDIGSNDGTFLNFFDRKNTNLYGIDPSAKKYKHFYNKKINLIVDYFSKKKILKEFGNIKFSLITSFAMFYDISQPRKFCSEIYDLLDEKGLWILEMSYFPALLKNLTYDQICHEHITYYTLSTFKKIANFCKLQVIDYSFNEINGGSIEIVCSKKKLLNNKKNKKIIFLLNKEKEINFSNYNKFLNRLENSKKVLREYILNIKLLKKKIYGYGASTKGNIILNYCGITNKEIPYICDANSYKYEKYTPGSNIKIVSKAFARKKNPKYFLVLIWSFRNEVIKQEKNFIEKGGKLIFPLPIFHLVDKSNYKSFLNKNFESFSYEI